MSIPFKVCLIVKAIKDEEAYKKMLEIWKYNNGFGSMTVHPCECDPPCYASEEDILELEQRLMKDMKDARKT